MWSLDSAHVHLVIVGLHLLGATVWTGGHLVLAATFLPAALRARDPALLLSFEQRYERIGLPALLLQVATGIWLALQRAPQWQHWLAPETAAERAVTLKLALLALTAGVAASARIGLIPNLTPERLPWLAAHIALVTLASIGYVLVGLSFRLGGIG
jgi:putative copper export protein